MTEADDILIEYGKTVVGGVCGGLIATSGIRDPVLSQLIFVPSVFLIGLFSWWFIGNIIPKIQEGDGLSRQNRRRGDDGGERNRVRYYQ